MEDFKMRNGIATHEDETTEYILSDWTSASKMRNYVNPLLRIDVTLLRNLGAAEGEDDIKGYQLTVYNVNTQVIVYKFYINYIKDNIFSFSTEEAIDFLNCIGFDCSYTEAPYLTEHARHLLESCRTLGYTHIKHIKNSADYLLIVANNIDNYSAVDTKLLRKLMAEEYGRFNFYDFRFITETPASIDKLLEDCQ